MENKSQNITTEGKNDTLKFKYLHVLTLRAIGKTYDEIAQKTGYKSDYLRRLFMKGGKLHEAYKTFQVIAHEESVEEAFAVMFGVLPQTARTLATTSQMPYDPAGVAASKIIMAYTLGDPSKPIFQQNNIQINDNRITGFEYVIPENPNETDIKTDMETTPSVPSIEGSNN